MNDYLLSCITNAAISITTFGVLFYKHIIPEAFHVIPSPLKVFQNVWGLFVRDFYEPDAIPVTQPAAACGFQGCKNRPAPFPGQMSYKATKPGLVSVLYLSMCYNYGIVVYYGPFLCIVSFHCCVLSFGCSG